MRDSRMAHERVVLGEDECVVDVGVDRVSVRGGRLPVWEAIRIQRVVNGVHDKEMTDGDAE